MTDADGPPSPADEPTVAQTPISDATTAMPVTPGPVTPGPDPSLPPATTGGYGAAAPGAQPAPGRSMWSTPLGIAVIVLFVLVLAGAVGVFLVARNGSNNTPATTSSTTTSSSSSTTTTAARTTTTTAARTTTTEPASTSTTSSSTTTTSTPTSSSSSTTAAP